MTGQPRVPVSVVNPLSRSGDAVQVNFCRMPACDNYGIHARTTPVKTGPSADRDMHYKVASTNKGRVSALVCKCCGEKPPIKSNQGIVEELARISDPLLGPDRGCTRKGCENHGKSTEEHPRSFHKLGYDKRTGRPLRGCKSCGGRFLIGMEPPRIHPQHHHLAASVFSRVVNKAPVRRTLQGIGLLHKPQLYYDIIRFIRRRCNHLTGGLERGMLRGQVPLPAKLHLVTDLQQYQLNWTDRLDKRNPMFSAICTVDKDSRYVFGLHANYDPDADSFAIAKESAERGDLERAEAFRRHARLWLPGDELMGGRAAGQRIGLDKVRELKKQLTEIYTSAVSRADVEDRELQEMHPGLHNPQAGKGMQVHVPYTVYAHFFMMREILRGAGVKKVEYSMDCESLLRGAFLSAWCDEVKQGTAHGFYVRHAKYRTVTERETAKKEAKSRLKMFRDGLPEKHKHEAALLLMMHNIEAATAYGKWQDRWFPHPLPTMNEPEKAVCWLTQREENPDSRLVARMAMRAGLGPVDNVFQLTRRFMNALERPIGTSSGYNTVWHGYAPYNPAMLQQYLDLFRTAHNFCHPGRDGKTPAMRLGLAEKPLSYDDVLWPGQVPPESPDITPTAGEDLVSRWDGENNTVTSEQDPVTQDQQLPAPGV